MTDQIILFETAKLAREKGFTELCYASYHPKTKKLENTLSYSENILDRNDVEYIDEISITDSISYNSTDSTRYDAPTQSLLQRWLREKHNIFVAVTFNNHTLKYYYFIFTNIKEQFSNRICSLPLQFRFYEEALERALIEGLKLIDNV